jgi:mannose-6-phosphate isomerase
MMPHFQFRPIYQTRVWGGRWLAQELRRTLPGSGPIGESWEIVDRPDSQSVVASGPHAGRSLRDLLVEQAPAIMGPGWPRGRAFPILVKWLDCQERLSLQVHPPASLAGSLGGEPKTENWYFARTSPQAAVLAGLKPGVTAESFAAALQRGEAEACVERLPVRPGDSLLIRSGVVHAIDAGCLVLEIQQNSDTTYRVFDWGRVGLDGKPRALHVRESLACLGAAPAEKPCVLPATDRTGVVLVDAPEFRLTRHGLSAGAKLHYPAGEQPRILSVVEGSLVTPAGSIVQRGDNILLPYAGEHIFTANGPTTLLVTDRFNGHGA